MVSFRIFLFISLFAFISGQCTVEKAKRFFQRSVYDFTVNLATRISEETETHFIASGISSWTLISAISLGATQDTLTEIAHVLRLHPHMCFNRRFFEIARQLTPAANDTTIMDRSATMFVDMRVNLKDDFRADVLKAGICSIEQLEFEDSASAVLYINDYVSETTREAIDEIVTSADLENAKIVMVDAIYFKGLWKTPFPYVDTETSAFYNDEGIQIGDVNLMFVSGKFNVARLRQLNTKVLELPYGDEERFSMLLFLPNENVAVNTLLNNLKTISLRTIFVLFEQHGESTVAVQIPRFKVTSDINNLKELLVDMGLRKMFSQSEARFEDLTEYPLYVSNFIQKAVIEVTEDGSEASAANEATFEGRMLPESFTANKPFVYMIVDKLAEVPLFVGAFSKPNVF